MSDLKEHIEYFKSSDKGLGLPFGIVDFKQSTRYIDDLYTPSLRDFHVIFWYKKGRGKYYIDFQPYTYEADTIILVSSNQVHSMDRLTSDQDMCSIIFQPDFLYRGDNQLIQMFQFTLSDHIKGQQVIKLNEQQKEQMQVLWNLMFETYANGSDTTLEQKFYHYLCLVLLECQNAQELLGPEEVKDDQAVLCDAFNELLEANYKQEYSVSYYADKMALTNKTLLRITKKHLHMTPKEAIDARRILEMKRLLRGSNQSIKNIAYDFGFEDPTNMVKYFKKHSGETPSNFKHRM